MQNPEQRNNRRSSEPTDSDRMEFVYSCILHLLVLLIAFSPVFTKKSVPKTSLLVTEGGGGGAGTERGKAGDNGTGEQALMRGTPGTSNTTADEIEIEFIQSVSPAVQPQVGVVDEKASAAEEAKAKELQAERARQKFASFKIKFDELRRMEAEKLALEQIKKNAELARVAQLNEAAQLATAGKDNFVNKGEGELKGINSAGQGGGEGTGKGTGVGSGGEAAKQKETNISIPAIEEVPEKKTVCTIESRSDRVRIVIFGEICPDATVGKPCEIELSFSNRNPARYAAVYTLQPTHFIIKDSSYMTKIFFVGPQLRVSGSIASSQVVWDNTVAVQKKDGSVQNDIDRLHKYATEKFSEIECYPRSVASFYDSPRDKFLDIN